MLVYVSCTSFSLKAGSRFRYISYEILCVADLGLGEAFFFFCLPTLPNCHGYPFMVAADVASVLFMVFTLSPSKFSSCLDRKLCFLLSLCHASFSHTVVMAYRWSKVDKQW